MKIEKVNENKLIITLTVYDLMDRNLDISKLSQNSPEAEEFFFSIMQEAEKKHGFMADDCQLFIEAYSASSGYFTITITKVEYNSAATEKKDSLKMVIRKKDTQKSNVFKFSSYETLSKIIKLIKMPLTTASLYKYNDSYYLIYSNIVSETSGFKKNMLKIAEFTEIVKSSKFLDSILREKGQLIFENLTLNQISKIF